MLSVSELCTTVTNRCKQMGIVCLSNIYVRVGEIRNRLFNSPKIKQHLTCANVNLFDVNCTNLNAQHKLIKST